VVIIFYLISYHIFYVANSMLSHGRIHLLVEQTGRPDHLSFTQQQLKQQKTAARWMKDLLT